MNKKKKVAKQKMEPKHDIMAKVDYVISNDETSKKKEKKKKSGFLKFLIIIILMLICAGICWFIFIKGNNNKEETYEKMVQNYYKYIEKQDKSGIISTYIPCTTKDENITSEIDNKLKSYNQLGDFKIEYKINSVENVNEEEQNSIKTSSIGTYCEIDNIPEITDYKHLYISQTLITDERTTTDIELWVVQINNKWYIVPTDENI